MDLKMNIYSPYLELVGILEAHRSVVWEEKAFGAGSFSVDSLITPESKALLVPDNIIWIDGTTAGTIQYFHENSDKTGNYITVKGPDLTGILDTHILWGRYDLKGTVPQIMRFLVDDCCVNPTRGDASARKIPGLVLLDAPTGGGIVQMQKTGGSLLTALEELGAAYGVSFGVRFNPQVPQMEFWTRWGQNRAVGQTTNKPVFYSRELDDVLSSEYSYNAQDYRNVALVAGEGEGKDRVMIVVENEAAEPPAPEQYTITLSVDPQGGGTATGGGSVVAGESVTVKAVPSTGYTFSAWKEDGAVVSTSVAYTFTVNRDLSLTAVFAATAPTQKIISVIVSDSTSVTSLLASGDLVVGGTKITGVSTQITTTQNEITISFALTKTIKIARSVSINGADIGHVGDEGDSVSITVPAQNGMTVAISFTNYVGPPSSRLPDGYTEVEYIQANGGSGINTGLYGNTLAKTRWMFDAEPLNDSDYFTILGSSYNQSSGSTYYYFELGGKLTGFYANFGPSSLSLKDFVSVRRMTIEFDATKYNAAGTTNTQINGEVDKKAFEFIAAKNTYMQYLPTAYIFAANRRTGSTSKKYYTGSGKLYSCKVYNADSALLRDFVPCINPSSAIGLYDLVEDKFYANEGAGTLTAGPAV